MHDRLAMEKAIAFVVEKMKLLAPSSPLLAIETLFSSHRHVQGSIVIESDASKRKVGKRSSLEVHEV